MAAHERQLAVNWTARIEFQIIVDLGGLPVFVNAKEADIEIESRVLKVFRIAPVKCDLLLGRKDQPDVIVTFVAIKMIRTTLIKRKDIGAKPGFVFALLFNRRDHKFARIRGLRALYF